MVIMDGFALNLLVHLVTDFNKCIITNFDVLFGTLARHFGAQHFLLWALAKLMRDLAQGPAQKNPCILFDFLF